MSALGVSKTNLALLFLLAGAIVWLWQAREEAAPALDLTRFAAPETFDPIRLTYVSGEDTVVVEKQADGKFVVSSPHFRDLGNETRIKQSIEAMKTFKSFRSLPDTNRASYDLLVPNHRFTAEDASGKRWSIALGDSSPVNSQVYAQLHSTPEDGEGLSPIFLTREFRARRDFYPQTADLRDPTPLPIDSPIVDSVHVITRTSRLRAVRHSKDSWESLEPEGLFLDPLPLNRGIRNLRSPVLRGYPREVDRKEIGLDPPRSVWKVFREGKVDSVVFGGPLPDQETVYVLPARRSFVAEMASDFYRDYVDGWTRMADLRPFSLEGAEVVSVEFLQARGDGGYFLEGGSWRRSPGDSLVAEQDPLRTDVENLTQLKWVSYDVEPPPEPKDGEELILRIASEARAETLRVVHRDGETQSWAWSYRHGRGGIIPARTFVLWQYRSENPGM